MAPPESFRIVGPAFVIGLTARDGVVRECAPYLRREVLGRSMAEVRDLCRRRRWTIERLNSGPENEYAR